MLNALLLGLIQGLTEFLPISSSGHIIVFEKLTGFESENVGFAAAIHLATFLAALIYFRKDVIKLTKSILLFNDTREEVVKNRHLAFNIILATIPAAILAFVVDKVEFFKVINSNLFIIGSTSIFFTILLYYSDKLNLISKTTTKSISYFQSVLIGLSQVLAAAFPGASRSGVTLTASFLSNLEREYATRFVFFISIPITGIASLYELVIKRSVYIDFNFIIAFIAAFIAGILAIHYLLYFIRRTSLKWLCVYRVVFGVVVMGIGMLMR